MKAVISATIAYIFTFPINDLIEVIFLSIVFFFVQRESNITSYPGFEFQYYSSADVLH